MQFCCTILKSHTFALSMFTVRGLEKRVLWEIQLLALVHKSYISRVLLMTNNTQQYTLWSLYTPLIKYTSIGMKQNGFLCLRISWPNICPVCWLLQLPYSCLSKSLWGYGQTRMCNLQVPKWIQNTNTQHLLHCYCTFIAHASVFYRPVHFWKCSWVWFMLSPEHSKSWVCLCTLAVRQRNGTRLRSVLKSVSMGSVQCDKPRNTRKNTHVQVL